MIESRQSDSWLAALDVPIIYMLNWPDNRAAKPCDPAFGMFAGMLIVMWVSRNPYLRIVGNGRARRGHRVGLRASSIDVVERRLVMQPSPARA